MNIKAASLKICPMNIQAASLTHCLLMSFGTRRQITVGANVAGGYIDTGNVLILINLQWMLSDQLCKS